MRNGEGIVVAGGVRTAIGKFAGAFKDTPSSDLGANAIRAAVERAGIAPEVVDEVILGCVGQVGEDAFNARLATLKAGLPEKTTAFNVNRLCGSGLQAINSAVQELRTGEAEVVVAAGTRTCRFSRTCCHEPRSAGGSARRRRSAAPRRLSRLPFAPTRWGFQPRK